MRRTLFCLFLACAPLHADDDLFRERFADPATRTAALAELIPGTQSAYFHTALAQQLAGREAEFTKTLADWKAATERKKDPISAAGLPVLENRQLLLDYQNNPVGSLAGLIRKLDLHFDDTRPDAAAAAESLPTRVDPALISEAEFEKAAEEKSPETAYTRYSGKRLYQELERVEQFDEAEVRWFMENLDRADLPGVVPLVDRMLGLDRTLSFTQLPLFTKLTANQLDSLMQLHPDLRGKESFALAYLSKLRPGAETDFERDPVAHAEHLKRCRDFVISLPPALNSLKAHVLYHHLRLQEEKGNFPKEDLLAYLVLPRTAHALLKVQKTATPETVDLGTDFTAATGCPPVGDDSALVRSYLEHFLGQTDSAAEFAPFVAEKPLVKIHARARLLAGADPSRWAAGLSPAEFKELQEKAGIDFAPSAPGLLDADAAVALTLDLKNTPDLLVRIYELDLPTALASHGEPPEVGIDLDGLVPHHERRLHYDQAPIRQHRETIALPELSGPGVWLVDFTAGQVSARALIRKGQLIAYPERTASGQTVRVFDEKGAPVPTASISLGRENFAADASGRIVIPDAPNAPVTRGLVRAGKLAAPIDLESRSDELALEARFFLDREQLLADQEAKLHLRVRLTNHQQELPLDRIKDPALVMKAELLGGVTTERVIAENLTLLPVMEIPFQVPADLLKLTLTLRGTVTPATGGDPLKLSQDTSYEINGDLKEARIGTAFFSPSAEGHRLEIRGRNGEPMPSRAIMLDFGRTGFGKHVNLQVRTDANGRVDLGALDGIDSVTATGRDFTGSLYAPDPITRQYPREIRLNVGGDIRLPAKTVDHLNVSLLEVSGDIPIRDHFDKISTDSGDLLIHGLPPGNFLLSQNGRITRITISAGKETEGLLVSKNQIGPLHAPVMPAITRATVEGDQVRIQLRNFGPGTRITLAGDRYRTSWPHTVDSYPFAPSLPDSITPGFASNGYLTDRRIDDETRYILDRRAAKTFPGAMLPRPGLLLNRWSEDTLEQKSKTGSGGQYGSARGGRGYAPSSEGSDNVDNMLSLPGNASTQVCDFLQFPSVVRFNLKPEADGTLKLPLADFTGSQFIQITATDAFANDTLRLALPASDTPLRDRRIARPLDARTHFLANRSAAVLQKGAEAAIENLLDADWRAFTTLTEAHQFLYGMNPDDRLREFVFLTEWPTFSEAKKLELLSQHSCHELHLFLARKDPEFFVKYVKPLLAGKPEPQFMDDYLLERDLSVYLRPYAWKRLNAAEKALLAQALPDARERITRELSLRWQLEAPAPDAETALFTQTLRGSDLALTDSLGLAKKDLQETPEQAELGNMEFGAGKISSGMAYLQRKLQTIVIPRIDFEDTSVEEAIDFLRLRAAELDTTELDPTKKGLNFIIRRPLAKAGGPSHDPDSDAGGLHIRELRLRNVPLATALKYICDQTNLRSKVDDFAVTLVPATEFSEDLSTGVFRVPPDFMEQLDSDDVAEGSTTDPFAQPKGRNHTRLGSRKPITDLLKQNGIDFPEGSSATLSINGVLFVNNSAVELQKIDEIVEAAKESKQEEERARGNGFSAEAPSVESEGMLPPLDFPSGPAQEGLSGPGSGGASFPVTPATPTTSRGFDTGLANRDGSDFISPPNGTSVNGSPADPSDFTEKGVTNGLRSGDQAINRNNIDAILNNPNRTAKSRRQADTFPDHTKLWREANYYKNTKPTDESLIPLNRFWIDLAAWDGKGPFLSPYFNACHTSANEALMCLALLDLPFKAERPEVTVDGSTLRVKAREPMLLFYKDTRKTENVAAESPLLVRQTFSPLGEPFRTVNGRQVENPVTGDFRPGVAYAASLIVTNPTGIGRRIDLLAQIPAGAIPLQGKPATHASTHELKPYGVVTEELAFYFPTAGEFPVYPLHVSENGSVLAHTDLRTLRVSNDPAPQDAASWQVLAGEGSNEEVIQRLTTENLDTLDLDAIRWRLKDPAFFLSVSKLLRERLHFSADVSSFGFLHNDVAAMREYLENSGAVRQLGQWLDSPLLEVRPRVHFAWETLEFDPLVNPRSHSFAGQSRLTHEEARAHYQALLDQLGWKSTLDASDQMTLTALLFLQDRIEEGLARFDQIDPAKFPGRLNYNYLHAVVLFYRENPVEAKMLAAQVLPTLPPGLWHDRFQAVVDQADEIAALAQPGEAEKPVAEAEAPQLDLALGDGGKLVIKHRALEKTTLRLFSVDLEVLFSKNPFLQGNDAGGGQPAILPNSSFEVALSKEQPETTIELPEGLRKGNILVAADSGSKKLLKVLDSKALELRHTPQDRTLQVLDAATLKPLSKTYIKVYAEMNSGETVFHKDGYTDLRGKFDYLSHTGIDPATVKRVAILISDPEKGARTVIYDR